ncbi:MAG: Ribosome-binding factor A [Bacteroidetes bacterium]|nr:Ribosome-binding factor A [Bacteroidota bacterium]
MVKEEVGTIFQRNFPMEEYGFITVTDVQMSPDLKIAKIYVSIFGDDSRKKKSLTLLESQKAFVRSSLGHQIRIKFTPEIVFYLDETIDRAMNLENIFKQIHKEDGSRKGSKE